MEYFLEELADELVGSAYYHKSEQDIKSVDYITVKSDFQDIKSFWGKACFIRFLELHTNPSIKACGGKLKRKVRAQDKAVYHRHIDKHYNNIKLLEFSGKMEEIMETVKEKLYDFGENEFIILCRVIYSAGKTEYIKELENTTTLPHGKKSLIETEYGKK